MILESISLHNIRSYKDQSISFSSGSTLLSGDIGSGKSTILLALEFALFGLMKGMISGQSLLRAGEKEGAVELAFSVQGKRILIKRTLKRNHEGIRQGPGYIIREGVKKEALPVELKSDILDILGYSRELAPKSKDLIFRYTVYTPQEEMKRILFDDRESRLDILRKIFGIERYKTIRENCQMVIRKLRESAREEQGKIVGYEEKKAESQKIAESIQVLAEKKEKKLPIRKEAEEARGMFVSLLTKMEADLERYEKMGRSLAILEMKQEAVLKERSAKKEEEKRLREELANVPPFVSEEGDTARLIEDARKVYAEAQRVVLDSEKRISGINAVKEGRQEIWNKIAELDVCPTCEQSVSEDHKAGIREREKKRIDSLDTDLSAILQGRDSALSKAESAEKNISLLQVQLTKEQVQKERILRIEEMKRRADRVSLEAAEAKEQIAEINKAKMELNQGLAGLAGVKAKYAELKKEKDDATEDFFRIDKEIGLIEKEIQGNMQHNISMEKDIRRMDEAKLSLKKIMATLRWLEDEFYVLVGEMERTILATVHNEFNMIFSQWFNMLIEEENLQLRLDETFNPIAEQDGYEVEVQSLSGGEKTACALAYRLALNRVINTIVDTILTRDLIILDEPTDGFSTEQLDRMRELLGLIDIKQVLLVSHEQIMESFVDRIIRIEKTDNTSEASS